MPQVGADATDSDPSQTTGQTGTVFGVEAPASAQREPTFEQEIHAPALVPIEPGHSRLSRALEVRVDSFAVQQKHLAVGELAQVGHLYSPQALCPAFLHAHAQSLVRALHSSAGEL